MASDSTVVPKDRPVSDAGDALLTAKRSRANERRVPTTRETLMTLPEPVASEIDFEPHDTIPAPPWLDDETAPEPPRKSS